MATSASLVSRGFLMTLVKNSIKRSPNNTSAEIMLPIFTWDSFNRAGRPCPIKLQRLMSAVRLAIYHIPDPTSGLCFIEYDTLTQENYTFVGSTWTKISEDFYDSADGCEQHRVFLTLGFVGNTSLNSKIRIENPTSGSVIAENINQVVYVSKDTRRPTKIPIWWKKKYAVSASLGKLITPELEPSLSAHNYRITVEWRDMDGYQHTNYVSYLMYCLDAAMDAVKKKHLVMFEHDILRYNIKEFSVLYKGESKPTDELLVKVWERPDSHPFILFFDISKNTETIFQNTISFYSSAVSEIQVTCDDA